LRAINGREQTMRLSNDDITIVVTVYRRLAYLQEAIESAVNQTQTVRVLLLDSGVEDVAALRRITDKFGTAVEYYRNPVSLPLFETMNRAIELCRTPWLSILHDDDALLPDFVENLTGVAPLAGDCRLFCGGTVFIDQKGDYFFRSGVPKTERLRMLSAEDFAYGNWFSFPGQLMHVETARALGGFPVNSTYTGDWDLWFRMAQAGGAAILGVDLSRYRSHGGTDRGTNSAGRSGRTNACRAMQCKRNLARLRAAGLPGEFDRRLFLQRNCPTYRETLTYAPYMSRWLLDYSRRILLLGKTGSRFEGLLSFCLRFFGNIGLRVAGETAALAERFGMRFRNQL
jgi:GT2 family glycosyltransferase